MILHRYNLWTVRVNYKHTADVIEKYVLFSSSIAHSFDNVYQIIPDSASYKAIFVSPKNFSHVRIS